MNSRINNTTDRRYTTAPATDMTSRQRSLKATSIVKKIRRNSALAFVLLLSATHINAQSLNQKLQSAFSRLQQDAQSTYASISLTVLDAKTGETVFTANPNMGLARRQP